MRQHSRKRRPEHRVGPREPEDERAAAIVRRRLRADVRRANAAAQQKATAQHVCWVVPRRSFVSFGAPQRRQLKEVRG
eukprot:7040994-Prymnesium_polylepis.1